MKFVVDLEAALGRALIYSVFAVGDSLAVDHGERDDFWATSSNKQLNFGFGRHCAPLRSLRSCKPSPQLQSHRDLLEKT
ncbi:hypothetical protein [Sulfurirhabdus autotrophica]|uniref:hypothetical protein n=1 Tax=Sulfurirhabdus autotrophica TaxID=1706046 RepID=UPI000F61037D|nr:hypothetical protein [Sulfurirhabdus autotrophica]